MQQNEQDSGQFSSAAANKSLSAERNAGRKKKGRGYKMNLEIRLRKGNDPLTTTKADIKSEQNFVQIMLYPLSNFCSYYLHISSFSDLKRKSGTKRKREPPSNRKKNRQEE